MAKKQQKKEWYSIVAPKMFRNAELGETTVFDPELLKGKEMMVNLMTITGNARNQNVKIKFKINKYQDNKALAEVIGYQMVNASVKRMVRRNVEKIEDSFTCATSDNIKLRLKPVIIARKPTSGSVATAVRKSAQMEIAKHAKALKYEAFAGDVVYHKLQEQLKKKLSKVYPIKMCEIKHMSIVKADNRSAAKEAQKEEPAQEAAAEN